jgi:hypothetical protein
MKSLSKMPQPRQRNSRGQLGSALHAVWTPTYDIEFDNPVLPAPHAFPLIDIFLSIEAHNETFLQISQRIKAETTHAPAAA